MELLAQVVADVTDALHGDVHALEIVLAELELHGRFDAATHAERGERRRIARAAMRWIDARHVLGLRADDLHVLEAGAAVLGGDVVTAHVLDEATERAEERDAIEVLLRPDEDALAAAVREAGERSLVGHAARQTERIDERVFVGVVRQKTTATERGP